MEPQGSINMTAAMEALSPLLNNPRRTIIQVEAFTSGIVLLLFLQLILGSFRRQSTNFFVQAGTWVTYTVSFPAIAYTLGLMQSSPVKNVMYPIWAVSLLMAAGCTNAVKVYELNDNRQWKRSLFNLCQYFIYTTSICYLLLPYTIDLAGYFHRLHDSFQPLRRSTLMKSSTVVVFLLCVTVLFTGLVGRELGCVFVELGYFRARKVAEFMKKLPAVAMTGANDGDEIDPASMKDYKYPLHISESGDDVTIDQIWQCEGRLLNSGTDHCKELKDSCLAYAMCLLLMRRYYGLSFAEEHLDETHDFVFKRLLKKEDDYERAFRIVEMELGFCHDYFFTKHAIIFELEGSFFFFFLVRIALIATCVSFVVHGSLAVKTSSAIIEVHTRRDDNIITILILVTFLLIELLQAAFYLSSDWCKVSVTSKYVSESCHQQSAFTEKLISYISRFAIFGYWKNKIGQYLLNPHITAADSFGERHPVSILHTVKRAIARSLRECDGPPTNGKGSLERNGVLGEFSGALQGQSQAEIMLVWNIATDYCNMIPPTGAGEHVNGTSENEQDTKFNRNVSVSLSRYCAYLKSAPELLPGYFGDTKLAIADVRKSYKFLTSTNSYQSMSSLRHQERDTSIFSRGVKLGKQLECNPSSAARWKILADFWAEKILYIAPSDNVKGHMELLAKGGEFLTHIWVLLTHAGILKINREEDNNATPRRQRQPPQGDV